MWLLRKPPYKQHRVLKPLFDNFSDFIFPIIEELYIKPTDPPPATAEGDWRVIVEVPLNIELSTVQRVVTEYF